MTGPNRKGSIGGDYPTPRQVQDFHHNAAVDKAREDIHHTVGRNRNQASPGDHTHDGVDSVAILDGIIITGARNTTGGVDSILNQLLNALEALGLSNGTTP